MNVEQMFFHERTMKDKAQRGSWNYRCNRTLYLDTTNCQQIKNIFQLIFLFWVARMENVRGREKSMAFLTRPDKRSDMLNAPFQSDGANIKLCCCKLHPLCDDNRALEFY